MYVDHFLNIYITQSVSGVPQSISTGPSQLNQVDSAAARWQHEQRVESNRQRLLSEGSRSEDLENELKCQERLVSDGDTETGILDSLMTR